MLQLQCFCTGKLDKTKLVQAEFLLGRFHLSTDGDTTLPWVFDKEQLKIAQQRLQLLFVPAHYSFNPQFLFSHLSWLKSHDWKQVLHKEFCAYIITFNNNIILFFIHTV